MTSLRVGKYLVLAACALLVVGAPPGKLPGQAPPASPPETITIDAQAPSRPFPHYLGTDVRVRPRHPLLA